MDNHESVFRKAAVARLSVPDELTEPLSIVRPRDFLVLTAITLVLCGAIVWSMAGRIAVTVPGLGIVRSSAASQAITSAQPARVLRIRAVSGSTVEASSPLVELRLAALRNTNGAALSPNGSAPTQIVVSPFRARIVEIAVKPGDNVAAGALLLTIEPADADLNAVLFLPEHLASQVRPGLEVFLSPKAFPTQQFGLLLGTVSNVAPSPTSDTGVKQQLNDASLAQLCLQQHFRVRVDVQLRRDEKQPGWQWSTGSGPEQSLYGGGQVAGEVVLRRERPIQWVMPWLR
jgi:multidrug efflux pump subunit AcrA (membrane-fusion protein)